MLALVHTMRYCLSMTYELLSPDRRCSSIWVGRKPAKNDAGAPIPMGTLARDAAHLRHWIKTSTGWVSITAERWYR